MSTPYGCRMTTCTAAVKPRVRTSQIHREVNRLVTVVSLAHSPLPLPAMLATSTFSLKRWDEKPYDEADGAPKLSRASVLYAFDGELSGEGRLEYLMTYLPDASAVFVGYQRFVGRIGSREGSFIFQHGGRFADGVASDTWVVLAGSGTSDLAGIRGQVDFSAAHQDRYEIIFEYELG
jgi:hypothetical protein